MTLTLADCFDYSTKKEVRIQSVPLGILKRFITFCVIVFVCYSLITQKRYQKKDSVISSVHTKVKGFADAYSRIWDTAEYTVPSPGGDSFFVITNIVKTEGQMQSKCSELPSQKTICSRDDVCKKGLADPQSNGIQTGRCITFNNTLKTCEVSAWCPVESQTTPVPAVLESAENFTVLIKNNIHFAAFNFTKKNILPNYNVSCIYDRVKAPLCPIFRLGDILREAGENFSQVAVLGGVIGIEINWDCDLDPLRYKCEPHYGFRRLDDKIVDESLYPGLNFRFARYYKNLHGSETRTLIKAYGIRFDIQVYGTGGKFNLLELALFIGSCLSYFGFASFAIDFIIGRYNSCCCNAKSVLKYYDDRKYETVPGPSVSLKSWLPNPQMPHHCNNKCYHRCLEQAHLKFVSFVDKEDILMVDQNVSGSLQFASGPYIQRERFAYTEAECKDSHKEDNIEMRRLKERSATQPSWCKCKKCLDIKEPEEQLCCRFEEGDCITDTYMFNSLILNRESLEYAFQYDNPLSKTPMCKEDIIRYAKQKYVEWRFGCRKYMLNFAVIPNCCKNAIETYKLQTRGPSGALHLPPAHGMR